MDNEIIANGEDGEMTEYELMYSSKSFDAVCHMCRDKMEYNFFTIDEVDELDGTKTHFQQFHLFGIPICEECRRKMIEIAGGEEKFNLRMEAIWKPVNDAYRKAYLETNLFCVADKENDADSTS